MKLEELVKDFGALEEIHVFELVKLTHRSHPIALRSPIEKALIDFTDSK